MGGMGFNTHLTHQMETGQLDRVSSVTKQSIYLRFVWYMDILAGWHDTWRLNYLFVDLFKMCYLLIYSISTHASTASAMILQCITLLSDTLKLAWIWYLMMISALFLWPDETVQQLTFIVLIVHDEYKLKLMGV